MNINSKPFFSIIIPVYQCENTLRHCVESVLLQNEDSYEIILVDDGSTDKSGEICDYYANMVSDKIIIIHEPNEGPLIARINAIHIAKGQYLMFLDSDDRYLPGILEQVKNAIETHRADMVIFNHFRILPGGNNQLYVAQYPDGKVFEGSDLTQLYIDAITGANLNALWQKCISRELLLNTEEFRQYGKMMMGEDKLISLTAIGRASRVVYLADGLYEYHVAPQSVSHNLSLGHYQDMESVYFQTLNYISQWKLDPYRSVCCKNKVEFGLSCLYSVADKISQRKKDISEFEALACYIISDQEYWKAFDICKKRMSLHMRIACWLLRHKWIRITFAYLYTGIIMKR